MAGLAQALQAGDGAAFEALVSNMLAADNDERKNAESVFEQLKESPDVLTTHLLQSLRRSPHDEHRSFCAIMIRKVLSKDDPPYVTKLSPNALSLLKHELLCSLKEDTQKTVVRKVCDTISEVAALVYDQPPSWPEIIPFMLQCVQSGNPSLMEAALNIFANLAHCLTNTFRADLAGLVTVLSNCLSHNHRDVQLGAMRAINGFLQALEEPAERERFVPMIPAMLQVLAACLNTNDEVSAQEVLEVFIEIAESHPRFLRKQLESVISAMLAVAAAEQLEDSTRQLAAEFLVTLCEAREKAPGMMRKLPEFVAQLFQTLMMFLLDVEDEPLWHNADSSEHEDEGGGDRYEFGQECLDRISVSMGGNSLVPAAGPLLLSWMSDQDWRKRHATLICLAQIAEGCAKVMVKQLDPLVDMCVKGLQDPHAKVRWASCQALGQMCTDLGPQIQDLCHAKILPALMAVMDDFNNPRVQAHASAAVVNFSENCEQELLPPYLGTLIGKLLLLLQHGKRLVQEGALTALASVADCSQTLFIEFYDRVMPLLTNILVNAHDKTHRLLRAKALECISLVGMAVGRDRFSGDAHTVMMFLQQLQLTEMDPDDPTGSYMLQAGARLCKCLGDQFLPYLSIVMPPLLKSATLEPDIKVTEDDEDDGEDEDDEDLERIPIGDKVITIRTSCLEEKSTACNMLCCYAGELKEGFFPYVKQVTDIMVPLLKFWFHEDVRRAAAQSLGELVNSAVLTVEKNTQPGVDMAFVQQMLEFIWPALMDALSKEPEAEVQSCMLSTVAEIVDLVDARLIQQDWVAAAFKCFQAIMKTSEERRAERLARQAHEDFDEEERELLEQENEAEEELFDQVGTCVGALLKKFNDAVLPYVEGIMPQIAPLLLDKKRNSEDRRIAVCIVDDLLEHSPAGRAKYAEQVLPMLLSGATDEYPDLRQCAAYGLGILAATAKEVVQPRIGPVLQALLSVVQHPEARSSENESATDNAISALGKVLDHCGDGPEGPTMAAAWINALPIKGDSVEAVASHNQLVRMLSARDAKIMGAVNANLPQVVRIFVEVLGHGTELASGETGQRMVALLHEMQAGIPAEVVQAALARLTPSQQSNFQVYMSGQVPQASS